MHTPASQPRESIYYDYQVFDPWLPPDAGRSLSGPLPRCQVAIVGAGPAGLVTALELARHGVASIVLESERQVSEGSRAIAFTRRTMEILQQVGVAAQVTAQGLPWRFGNSFYCGERVFRMEAPHDPDDRFWPMINLQQQYLEQSLVEACVANPAIELRWGNRLTALDQADGFMRATIDTPAGEYPLETDWLIAADGARSGVRSALDLKMTGDSYDARFVIADIRIDLPLPTERMAWFDPPWNRGNTILMHREPHGLWRIDYQLQHGESPEAALRPDALRRCIDAQLAMIGHADKPWELDWCSVYSARAMTLADYVHGNVLFCGDAAHLLPIFGVRGANTAFQDAQSLGWQLALVVKGMAGRSLLANYSAERVGAAREIIDEAGKSTRFMTPPTRGFRLLRDAVLSLSLTREFVRPLYHWRTSRPHAYLRSRLNALDDDNHRFEGGPADGEPPRDVRLGNDDHLLDHLGGGFDLLCFTSAGTLPESLRAVLSSWRTRGIAIRVSTIGAAAPIEGADQCLADPDGRVRERYGVHVDGAAYLLRPDQHVCARWLALDARRVDAALKIALPT